jgi:hypothetical protein
VVALFSGNVQAAIHPADLDRAFLYSLISAFWPNGELHFPTCYCALHPGTTRRQVRANSAEFSLVTFGSDAKANLAVLQKISTNWEQGDYLEKGGWATPPGATSPDYQLARACAEKLAQAKTAAQ